MTVQLEQLGLLGLLAHKEREALLAQLVQLAHEEKKAQLALLGPLAHKGREALLAQRGHEEK